jgi:hypothetical protein
MNDPPPISFKNDTKTNIALLSKGFRATSPLHFALMRQKASTFSKNCLSFTTEASGG